MKVSIHILLTLLLIEVAFGQNTRSFQDEKGLLGSVQFRGVFSDTILPNQGPFALQWREIDGEKVVTYSVNGNLSNHLPQGNWNWQQGAWTYSVNASQSVQPSFSSAGTVARWSGAFDKGIPVRNWQYNLDSLDQSGRVAEKLLQIRWTYKNGLVSGNFSVEDFRKESQFHLSGATNERGEANGEWVYTYTNSKSEKVTEKHLYRQGLLQSVTVYSRDTVKTEFIRNQNFFDKSKTNTNAVVIGSRNFLKSEFNGITDSLWNNLLKNNFLKGWSLSVFPFEAVLSTPVFKKLEYPFSEEEKQQIESIKAISLSIQEKINNYIQGEMLIQRSRSSAMDLSVSFLEQTLKRMHLIDSLMLRTELPEFTYKNRHQQGVLHYIKAINEMSMVKAEVYDTMELQLPLIVADSANFRLFFELENLVKISEQSIEEHFEIIEREKFAIQRENERKAMEDELLDAFRNLQELFNHTNGVGLQIRQKWIDDSIQQDIIKYAQENDFEVAMQLAGRILLRIDTIALLHNRVEVFDNMDTRISAEYNRMVYNPYTGKNDLELTVKKRFVNTVLENLWPWLELRIENEQNWASWKRLWEQQFEVYNFVMTFANREDKQAQKINKKVRKETNPEKILRLLN